MKTFLSLAVTTTLVAAIAYTLFHRSTASLTLHLAGDSLISRQNESRKPLTGWGEPLTLMKCEEVQVINHAKNGHSTKSFINEGLWNNLLALVKPKDIVLIQFGHNDQKITQSKVYTNAQLEYKDNLNRFITDVQSHQAIPVLITPVVRRAFNSQGKLEPTLGHYPQAAKEVARKRNILLLDLHSSTAKLVQEAGEINSKQLFVHLQKNEHKNYPQGIEDNTHLSEKGAFIVASLVADKLNTPFPTLFCP